MNTIFKYQSLVEPLRVDKNAFLVWKRMMVSQNCHVIIHMLKKEKKRRKRNVFLEVGDCSISYSSNGKSRVMKKKRRMYTREL